jgi:hypothetical protein
MSAKVELPPMDLYGAIQSPLIFRSYFPDLGTWRNWLTFSKLLTGRTDFDASERRLIRECAGLVVLPMVPIRECYIIAGRRSGKSTWTSLLACFYSVFGGWQRYLKRGETARIFIVATNIAQGQIVKKYLDAFFSLTPTLKGMVKRTLADSVELKSGVTIEVKPASWRTTRGFTVGLLIMEEMAYFRYADTSSAVPDVDIYQSIVPSMSTIKNSLTIGISTPFGRAGLLYSKFSKHFGKPGPVLVWRAPSWVMNLELNEAELEEQFKENLGEAAYLAEYACQWRADIETYLTEELVDLAMKGQPMSRPYDGRSMYVVFVDPSELVHKSGDSMTIAVAHRAGERVVLDLVEEILPPENPKKAVAKFTEICRRYHVGTITQDRVSLGWIKSDFEPLNIEVKVAEETKSELYELLAVMASKRLVDLLDIPRLRRQIGTLETRLGSMGSVKIDHIPSGKDDVINAAAGALVEAAKTDSAGGFLGVLAHDVHPDDGALSAPREFGYGHEFFKNIVLTGRRPK